MAVLGATTPVQPNYPLHILQVNTLDNTGAPSNVLVVLVNADNARAFSAGVSSSRGITRVAVPDGSYAAISYDLTRPTRTRGRGHRSRRPRSRRPPARCPRWARARTRDRRRTPAGTSAVENGTCGSARRFINSVRCASNLSSMRSL